LGVKSNLTLVNKFLLSIQVLFFFTIAMGQALYAAAPAGYYSTATASGATLKTQLYNIIKNHTDLGYDNLWTAFQSTDAKANGKVWDMYSDVPGGTPPYEYTFVTSQCGNYSVEGDCFNREHSFPASWFNDATPMYTDLFHLYPTDGKVNGIRSNYPYGKVGTASQTTLNGSKLGASSVAGYSGTVFEPIDEYKGDFARTYFYMATRYENVISSWYSNSTEANAVLQNNNFPVFETWFLNMLGEWHVQDPVSAKETARNDAVYTLQGNRNPYIDNPQYVYSVWGVGATGPAEPQAHVTNFSARNIRLQWTDASGAVVPDGYLVRMSAIGFGNIASPVDGVSYPGSSTDFHVPYGQQQLWIKNLSAGTYYFKIFAYTGSGVAIDYKTDGSVPETSKIIN